MIQSIVPKERKTDSYSCNSSELLTKYLKLLKKGV